MSPTQIRSGYVYVIRLGVPAPDADIGLYKIGRSVGNPYIRMRTLQTASPERLWMMFYGWHEDAYAAERDNHQFYERNRRSGEWFELSTDCLHGLFLRVDPAAYEIEGRLYLTAHPAVLKFDGDYLLRSSRPPQEAA